MIIKMLTSLRRRIDEHSENFNKESENSRKNQTKLKCAIIEITTTLEGTNSRLEDLEERISDLECRVMESTQAEQEKQKKRIKKKMRIVEETSGTTSSILTFDYCCPRRIRERGKDGEFIQRNNSCKFPDLGKEVDIHV